MKVPTFVAELAPRSFAEAVDDLAHRSKRTLEQMATRIGRSANHLRKATSQYDDAHHLRGDLIVPLTLASADSPDERNYVVIEHMAAELGGTFLRPPQLGDTATDDVQVAGAMKEFAEFVTAVCEGSADQKYTDAEVARIAAEWHDVMAAGSRLVRSIISRRAAQQLAEPSRGPVEHRR